MTRVTAFVVVTLLSVSAPAVEAVDHANLDENRPLRVEDAYPIASGEISVETGAGFTLARRGPNRGAFPIEILYGVLPNVQLGLGTSVLTDPHGLQDPPKSGDLRLGALYNFNQESLHLPALAAKLSLDAPTGIAARGYGVGLKGIVTKSVARLSFHLNAGYAFLTDSRDDERTSRYVLAFGASYPIGAPRFTRATLIADVFAEQPVARRDPTSVGSEIGVRYQLTPWIVWDIGLGTELAGRATRSRFLMTTGLSFGF
jgi:hypothetical protein